MAKAKTLLTCLIVIALVSTSSGFDFFGWFRTSNSSASAKTATTVPPSTTTVRTTPRTIPTTTTSGTCWWTTCGVRCATGTTFHDVNACPEPHPKGTYKFRCCSSPSVF